MVNVFYIDGRKVEQEDKFRDGSCWFSMMLLPDRSDTVGAFTPVEFARHRLWGLDPEWASRCAIYAPMQDEGDGYNGGFWPMKKCEPSEVIRAGETHQKKYRACVFNY